MTWVTFLLLEALVDFQMCLVATVDVPFGVRKHPCYDFQAPYLPALMESKSRDAKRQVVCWERPYNYIPNLQEWEAMMTMK